MSNKNFCCILAFSDGLYADDSLFYVPKQESRTLAPRQRKKNQTVDEMQKLSYVTNEVKLTRKKRLRTLSQRHQEHLVSSQR